MKRFKHHVKRLKVLTLFVVALSFFVLVIFRSYRLPPFRYWVSNPMNFEECKEATRGFILQTFPTQCEFRGKKFIDQSLEKVGISSSASRTQDSRKISDAFKVYRNEKYGFQFTYPKDHTAYTDIDRKKDTLIPAVATSTRIAIADGEWALFCCEASILEFLILHTNISPRDWVDFNYHEYVGEKDKKRIQSIKDITFAGVDALEFIGMDERDFTFKFLIIPRDGYLLIIHRNLIYPNEESKFLDDILATFKFT